MNFNSIFNAQAPFYPKFFVLGSAVFKLRKTIEEAFAEALRVFLARDHLALEAIEWAHIGVVWVHKLGAVVVDILVQVVAEFLQVSLPLLEELLLDFREGLRAIVAVDICPLEQLMALDDCLAALREET
mmetsp:Transcript_28241/g.37684  ORF Transcript_28241/g.37684 Transcript_28241/m.37684 type:complete len:129 (+) Transcript_28241:67-453(+)